MDAVFKALADPTRRRLLDELFREDGQNLSALHARLPRGLRVGGRPLLERAVAQPEAAAVPRAGDAAVLDVEGTMASGIKALTLVRMIKGSSRWLFESATLAGMLP